MAIMDIVKQRKSVRKYLEKPIPREHIVQCIEAARLAPSADNLQPWRFIVLDDRVLIEKLTASVCTGCTANRREAVKATPPRRVTRDIPKKSRLALTACNAMLTQ